MLNVDIQSDYDVEIRWRGTPPGGDIQAAFVNSANRIMAGVVGQLSAVVFSNFDAGACVSGLRLTDTIPGLVIYATVEAIDGPGQVLGSAGPCYIRTSNQLTIVGRMRFDVADLENLQNQGRLEPVILHEMLHVIGVGTLWNVKGLRSGEAPASTPYFVGALATSACMNDHAGGAFCANGVPAEDCVNAPSSCVPGGGTINSHWKESVFQPELMTGYLSAGLNPFSKMTLQSLADMGYTVNLNITDPFTVPPPALMSPIPAWSLKLPDPHGALSSVDAFGRARSLGLRVVAHAGEEGPPEYVWQALDLLGAERIEHGVRSMEDPALVERLARDRVPLTVCPLSNVRLKVVDRAEDHPLRKMLEAGLNVSINSDDPAYFGGYIGDAYLETARALDLSEGQLATVARNSLEACFVSDAERAALTARLDDYLGARPAGAEGD